MSLYINQKDITVTKKLSGDIASLIRSGDKSGINQLYDTYFDFVLIFVQRHGGTSEDGRDIFQESAISLYSTLRKNPDLIIDNFDAYFTRLYKNRWYTFYNKQQKNKEAQNQWQVEVAEPVEDERYTMYLTALSKMKTECQNAIKYYLQGLSVEEMAIKMNTSKDYAKRKKYLCKEELKKMIKERMARK